MARAGLRIGIFGATGALGGEVLAVLAESGLPVAEIVPMAKDDSIGRDVELHGEVYAVESGLARLRGLDFVILCAPAAASLDAVREALRASVPCIDASGVLAASPEVALQVAAFGARWSPDAPLLVTPPGPALALALVLRPLALAAGLVRVSVTLLEGASTGGRAGIDALYQESLALFNQQDLPDPGVFARPVAFDCIPVLGELDENGGSDHENALVRSLARLLGEDLQDRRHGGPGSDLQRARRVRGARDRAPARSQGGRSRARRGARRRDVDRESARCDDAGRGGAGVGGRRAAAARSDVGACARALDRRRSAAPVRGERRGPRRHPFRRHALMRRVRRARSTGLGAH